MRAACWERSGLPLVRWAESKGMGIEARLVEKEKGLRHSPQAVRAEVYGNRTHWEPLSNPPAVLKTGALARGANTSECSGIMPRQPNLRKKQVGKSVCWFTKAGAEAIRQSPRYNTNGRDDPQEQGASAQERHAEGRASSVVPSRRPPASGHPQQRVGRLAFRPRTDGPS